MRAAHHLFGKVHPDRCVLLLAAAFSNRLQQVGQLMGMARRRIVLLRLHLKPMATALMQHHQQVQLSQPLKRLVLQLQLQVQRSRSKGRGRQRIRLQRQAKRRKRREVLHQSQESVAAPSLWLVHLLQSHLLMVTATRRGRLRRILQVQQQRQQQEQSQAKARILARVQLGSREIRKLCQGRAASNRREVRMSKGPAAPLQAGGADINAQPYQTAVSEHAVVHWWGFAIVIHLVRMALHVHKVQPTMGANSGLFANPHKRCFTVSQCHFLLSVQ
jgi:hypothetical protein